MNARRIYLDHNATTPVAAQVAEAMSVAAATLWGNPSSLHAEGRRSRDAVERARAQVAGLLGVDGEEIVFTSGGTEGDALAILGLARAARAAGRAARVVSSPLEHPAVAGALAQLRSEGWQVDLLPVDARGGIDPGDLQRALERETALVTLAAANHEIGAVASLAELTERAHEAGALFHTDAVQAAGRIPLDARRAGVDAATISAHKLYGPKGVGALFLRRGVALDPIASGGHQERGRRAGTENVAGIVGFGVACELARAELAGAQARMRALGARLQERLLAMPGARLHGDADPGRRVPGTVAVGFSGAPGQLVMIGLDLEGVSVSTGAACSSGSPAPSPVLLALGLTRQEALEGLRFSLGRGTTESEIDEAAALTEGVVKRVRAASSGASG